MVVGVRKNKALLFFVIAALTLGCGDRTAAPDAIIESAGPSQKSFRLGFWQPLTTGQHYAILPATNAGGEVFYTVSKADSVRSYRRKKSVRTEIYLDHLDPYQIRSSADGSVKVFTAQTNDAKGDIFIQTTSWTGLTETKKISDRHTEDIDADISSDGKTLVYSSRIYQGQFRLVLYDIARSQATPLGIDGVQARFSPDSRSIVFQKKANLFLYQIQSKRLVQLTDSIALDAFPIFGPHAQSVYFHRKVIDTDGDYRLSAYDKGAIWQVDTASRELKQLTSSAQDPNHPALLQSQLITSISHKDNRNLSKYVAGEESAVNIESLDIFLDAEDYDYAISSLRKRSGGRPTWIYWQLRSGQMFSLIAAGRQSLIAVEQWAAALENRPWAEQSPAALKKLADHCKSIATTSFGGQLCSVNAAILAIKTGKGELNSLQSLQAIDFETLPKQMKADIWLLRFILGQNLSGEQIAAQELDRTCSRLSRGHKSYLDRSLTAFTEITHFAPSFLFQCETLKALQELRKFKSEAVPVTDPTYPYRLLALLELAGHNPNLALELIGELQKSQKLGNLLPQIAAVYRKVRAKLVSIATVRQLDWLDSGFAGLFLEAGQKLANIGEFGTAIDFYRQGLGVARGSPALIKAIIDSYAAQGRLEFLKLDNFFRAGLSREDRQYLEVYVDSYRIDRAEDAAAKLEIIQALALSMSDLDVSPAFLANYHQTYGWLSYQEAIWTESLAKTGFIAATRRLFGTLFDYFSGSNRNPLQQSIYHYELAISQLSGRSRSRADLALNLGSAYYALKNYNEALAAFEQRLDLEKDFSLQPRVHLSTAIQAGRAAFQIKDYQTARLRFEQTLRLAATLDDAKVIQTYRMFLGRTMYYEGDYRAITLLYQNSYADLPEAANDIHFDILMAESQLALKEPELAQAFITEAEIKLTRFFKVNANPEAADDRIRVSLTGRESNTEGFDKYVLRMQIAMIKTRIALANHNYTAADQHLNSKLKVQLNVDQAPALSDPIDIATTYSQLGFFAFINGEYEQAQSYFEKGAQSSEEAATDKDSVFRRNNENLEATTKIRSISAGPALADTPPQKILSDASDDQTSLEEVKKSPSINAKIKEAIGQGRLWEHYLSRGFLSEAYDSLITSRQFDRYSHWPSIKTFLKIQLPVVLTKTGSVEDRFNKLIQHYEFLKNATNSRLTLKDPISGPQLPYAANLGSSSLFIILRDTRGYILWQKTSSGIIESKSSNLGGLVQMFKELSAEYQHSFIILNEDTLGIYPKLHMVANSISLISAASDIRVPLKNQLVASISTRGALSPTTTGCSVNYELRKSEERSDLRIDLQPTLPNAAYNSLANSDRSNFKKPGFADFQAVLLEDLKNLSSDTVRALYLQARSLSAEGLLILENPAQIEDLLCKFGGEPSSIAVRQMKSLKLGYFGDAQQFAEAPTKAELSRRPLLEQYYWLSKLGEAAPAQAVLRSLRNERQASGSWASALHYQRLLVAKLQDQGAIPIDLAQELFNQAIVEIKASHYKAAVKSAHTAATIYKEDEDIYGQANALRIAAIAHANAKQFTEGAAALQLAIGLLSDDNWEKAAYQLHLANYYKEYLSDFSKSMKLYNKSLAAYRAEGDAEAAQRVELDQANTYIELGNLVQATAILERPLIEQDQDFQIRRRLSLMKAYYFNGEYQRAAAASEQLALQLSKTENKQLQIDYLNNEAILALKISGLSAAEAAVRRAIQLAEDLEVKEKLSLSISNYGFILRKAGLFEKAIQRFRKALIIDQTLRNERNIAYDLRNLGFAELGLKQYKRAKDYFKKAVEINGKLHLAYNHIYTQLGLAEIELAEGRAAAAGEIALATHAYAQDKGFYDLSWRAMGLAAQSMRRQGELEQAEILYSKAIQIISRLQASLKNRNLQSQFRADSSMQSVFEEAILTLLDQGKIEAAWRLNEQSRARAFVDSLAGVENDDPPAEYLEYLSLKKQISEPVSEPSQRQDLADRLLTLEDTLAERYPKHFRLVSSRGVASAELRRFLPKDTVVLEYFVAEQETIVWILSKQSLAVKRLAVPYQQLKEAVETYRSILLSYGAADTIGAEIMEQVLEPVLDDIEGMKAIGIIGHGPLQYLPFASLPFQGSYLVDAYSLFHLEHGSMIESLAPDADKAPTTNILGLGNPDRGKQLDLPFAEKELKSIARYYPGAKLFANKSAHTQNLKANMGAADYIHIASHGVFNEDSPKRSKLLLARDPDSPGELTVENVLNLNFRSDLTVLSACESGLGDINRADSMIGLNRAFFLAGSEAVVSTLWRIDDVASAMTMKALLSLPVRGPQ